MVRSRGVKSHQNAIPIEGDSAKDQELKVLYGFRVLYLTLGLVAQVHMHVIVMLRT